MLGAHPEDGTARADGRGRTVDDNGDAGGPEGDPARVRVERAVDEVHGGHPEEAGDEVVDGVRVDGEGRPDLLDDAVVHDHDAVGHRHGLRLVVGDVEECRPQGGVKPLELGSHLDAEPGVQARERLVHEEGAGAHDDGPGEGHPLRLPAREGGRALAEQGRHADGLRDRLHPGPHLCRRRLPDPEREGDVVEDVHVREEREALEDHAELPVARLPVGDTLSADVDVARRRRLEPRDHVERRGLAAPGGAHEDGELAVGDVEAHPVHGAAGAKRLGEPRQPDPGHRAPTFSGGRS